MGGRGRAQAAEVRQAVRLPVLIGSGVTLDNWRSFRDAHAFIVGSHFKRDGDWRQPLDTARIHALVRAVRDGQ